MSIDDHTKMYGGRDNTLTVRLTQAEIKKLLSGEILSGVNQSGCQTRVLLMVQEKVEPIAAS